jgi:uncharacterized membrane protein YfcA
VEKHGECLRIAGETAKKVGENGCALSDGEKMSSLICLVIGFLTGAFSGLLGIGGGVVLVPMILYFFKLTQRQAQAVSMAVMVFTGISGAVTYALNGVVDYFAVLVLTAGAIIPARLGVVFSHNLAEWKLKRAFGFFLIAVSLLLIVKPYIAHIVTPISGCKGVVLLIIGVFAGLLSGIMGVGGGGIMIPAMVLLLGMSQITAQGNSLMCIVPTSAMGAYTHWRLGNIRSMLLPGLISGILLGVYAGGNLACHYPEEVLRSAFAVILILRGIVYIRTVSPEFIVD